MMFLFQGIRLAPKALLVADFQLKEKGWEKIKLTSILCTGSHFGSLRLFVLEM